MTRDAAMNLSDELHKLADAISRRTQLPAKDKLARDWTEDESDAVLESMASDIRSGLYTWADLVREAERHDQQKKDDGAAESG